MYVCDVGLQIAQLALTMLVAALSKLVPRALQKKVATTFRSSDSDARTNSESNVCHVVLLDDTEMQLDIKVSQFYDCVILLLLLILLLLVADFL